MPDQSTRIIDPEPNGSIPSNWIAMNEPLRRLGQPIDPQVTFRMEIGTRVIMFVNGTIYAMRLESIEGDTVVFKSLASSRLE